MFLLISLESVFIVTIILLGAQLVIIFLAIFLLDRLRMWPHHSPAPVRRDQPHRLTHQKSYQPQGKLTADVLARDLSFFIRIQYFCISVLVKKKIIEPNIS